MVDVVQLPAHDVPCPVKDEQEAVGRRAQGVRPRRALDAMPPPVALGHFPHRRLLSALQTAAEKTDGAGHAYARERVRAMGSPTQQAHVLSGPAR